MNYSLPSTFRRYNRNAVILILSMVLASISGCSSITSFFEPTAPEDMNLNIPAETLVKKGMEEYNRGKYYMAVEYFTKVLDSHRFTPEALQAELKLADSNFFMEKYAAAFIYYEKFEEMHPTNEAIPYVMYQKALCYYKRIDRVDRDTTGATKAIENFQQLLKAYPNSPYTEDARAKIASSTEFLANHEYIVAQFYIRTDKYDEALVRLKYLIAAYPDSKIIAQARKTLEEVEAE